jgi:esterase
MHLFHRETGTGFPLIILHGLFGSLTNWDSMARKLGEFSKVSTVDQRNHGRSPHDPVHTYAAMADDLFELFASQGLHRASLLGHSMGGKAAMEFALSHPEWVDRLLVVDIAPVMYPPGHDTIFNGLESIDPSRYNSRSEIDRALALRIPDERVRQFLLTNLRREEGGGYAWKFNLDALKRNYPGLNAAIEPRGRRFDGPVLFLRGGRSSYVRDEYLNGIDRIFPHYNVETVDGAGHWIHADAPDLFLDAVRKFLLQ